MRIKNISIGHFLIQDYTNGLTYVNVINKIENINNYKTV